MDNNQRRFVSRGVLAVIEQCNQLYLVTVGGAGEDTNVQ